jgi:hypothetical protein
MAKQSEMLDCVGKKVTLSWFNSCVDPKTGKRFKMPMKETGVLYAYLSDTCKLKNKHYDYLISSTTNGCGKVITWNNAKTVTILEVGK